MLVTIRNSSPEPCRRDQTQNPQARRPPALTEGQWVRVPYPVVYDLRADQISALRIYFLMSVLIEQLTN